MKKLYFLLFAISISAFSFGQVIVSDDFTYADGPLVGNGTWATHSGAPGTLLVSSGEVVVQHGIPDEDANIPFTPVAGKIYYAVDFSVDNPGGPIVGTDNEYFASFREGFNLRARLDVVPASGGGDYTVGIATSGGSADNTWATDLTYGTSYRATVMYDQDANIAQLWIDASAEGDTSILGADNADPGDSMDSFALRQSDSDLNEAVRVDNLIVAQSFGETLSNNDYAAPKRFSVYPNPTNTGSVNVVSTNTTNFGQMNIAVYDVLGKQVINKVMTSEKLNVSSLNAGVYIMKITQGKATSTKKLVIN